GAATAAPRLVSPEPQGPPVEEHPRSVPHLGLGGHAAADPDRHHASILPEVHRPLSLRRPPRPRPRGRGLGPLVGPRLLPARPAPACRRAQRDEPARGSNSPRRSGVRPSAGSRTLYARRGPLHSFRPFFAGA